MISQEKQIRTWLKEPAWWGIDSAPRGKILLAFVKEGLIPFIESKGYKFGRSANELFTDIATCLYVNWNYSAMETMILDVPCNPDGTAEERIHYYDTVGVDDWTAFWSEWSDWSEIATTEAARGRDRQINIEEYVWRQLDLDNSLQTEVLYYRMNDETPEDSAEDGTKRPDVYLEEASGWGGLRK